MKEKEQIIDKLDFTEEQYNKVRLARWLTFDEMVDNAIKDFEALAHDGWFHGDKVEEVTFILNNMWSQLSK